MARHNDDDPVMVSYSSSRNIRFRSQEPEELGVTWGEWREMSQEARNETLADYVFDLVEVSIEGAD